MCQRPTINVTVTPSTTMALAPMTPLPEKALAPAKKEISARRADYTTWQPQAASKTAAAASSSLTIEPCESLEPLADIRGALKKLKHDKNFLHKIFERRDREIFPRDLLVAYLPAKKAGKLRAVGLLRRSLVFDKEKNSKALSIDFVWVMPEVRACGCGRQLMAAGLTCGKPKDVHLQVAGSEDNKAAVGLYSSLGFVWDENAPKKTEMILEADKVVEAAEKAKARRKEPQAQPVATPTPPPTQEAGGGVDVALQVFASGRVALRVTVARAAADEVVEVSDAKPMSRVHRHSKIGG